MNSIIIVQVLKTSTRKQISNVLLFNQAVVDIVYNLAYLTPLIVTHFHNVTYSEYSSVIDSMQIFGVALSAKLSVYSFLINAAERHLAIVKPLWHRINFTKKDILKFIF